jgi:hypothetical protein
VARARPRALRPERRPMIRVGAESPTSDRASCSADSAPDKRRPPIGFKSRPILSRPQTPIGVWGLFVLQPDSGPRVKRSGTSPRTPGMSSVMIALWYERTSSSWSLPGSTGGDPAPDRPRSPKWPLEPFSTPGPAWYGQAGKTPQWTACECAVLIQARAGGVCADQTTTSVAGV